MSEINWKPKVKLILSDVDETVADLYLPAEPEMITELERILTEDKAIFFITGHGLTGVMERITNRIQPKLRKRILISHCSGAEVWGFMDSGELMSEPYYSLYDQSLNDKQKLRWRQIIEQLTDEFRLVKYPASPISEFKKNAGDNPLAVMYEDRGPQITLEVINGYDLSPAQLKSVGNKIPNTHGHYDLRIPIMEKALSMLSDTGIPITPRLGGVFALDFAVKGVSKTTSVRHVLDDKEILAKLGLEENDINDPDKMEIWGDKYSVIRGGSDRYMCEAVNPKVRAIDFRHEDANEFPPGYNIVIWDGEKQLQEGLLEYLQKRSQERSEII